MHPIGLILGFWSGDSYLSFPKQIVRMSATFAPLGERPEIKEGFADGIRIARNLKRIAVNPAKGESTKAKAGTANLRVSAESSARLQPSAG